MWKKIKILYKLQNVTIRLRKVEAFKNKDFNVSIKIFNMKRF